MTRKNSSPTIRQAAGKLARSASIKPTTTLFRYTANLLGQGCPSGPIRSAGTASAGSSSAAANPRCLSCKGCTALSLPVHGAHDRFRSIRFRRELRPRRYLRIPFDQCRRRTKARDGMLEQAPDDLVDGPVVGIDQGRPALVVRLPRVAREMDLLHARERIFVDVARRIPLLIDRRDIDVVDIEEKRAARPPHDLGDKVDLGIGALG